jgi:hypothetical protein
LWKVLPFPSQPKIINNDNCDGGGGGGGGGSSNNDNDNSHISINTSINLLIVKWYN